MKDPVRRTLRASKDQFDSFDINPSEFKEEGDSEIDVKNRYINWVRSRSRFMRDEIVRTLDQHPPANKETAK